MSRSSRQISHSKDSPKTISTPVTHLRNKSIQNKNFSSLLEKGKQFYQSNQMNAAIDHLERGLYYDCNNLEVNFMLGIAHMTLNSYGKALQYLGKVVELNNKFKNNLHMLLAIIHKKRGDLKAALSSISSQIQLHDDHQSLFYRAKILFKLKLTSRAIEDCNRILSNVPSHGPAAILKIKCLLSSEQYQQALQVVRSSRQVVQQIDKLQEISIEQVKILLHQGKFNEALMEIQALERQFVIISEDAQLIKGKALQKANKSQEAIIYYNQILSKNTKSRMFCEAIAEMAIYYMKERDFYEAFSYLKRTHLQKLKSRPTDNLLKLAEGLTFLMKKKYAEAILLIGSCQLDFQHSLQEYSSFLCNLYLNSLAYGNFCIKNHETALQLYKKITKDEPNTDSSSVLYNISICEGIILHKKGKRDEALQCFQMAYQYIPRPQPYFYVAVILNEDYLKQSINTEGFIKILELIEKGLRAGQSAHMYYYRAVIYLFLGMNSEALEDIDRAIEKSEDNVARYFHTRGVIFMLDKNYEQAIMEFGTALSIDEKAEYSAIEKAKCELLNGDSQTAYSSIQGLDKEDEWRVYFNFYQKNYEGIIQSNCENELVLQVCHFMTGKFEKAGPSGKMVIAVMYQNYAEVIKLIEEAVNLNVSVGCLDLNDLLILKAYSEYRLHQYEQSIVTLFRVEKSLRQSNSRNESYCEQDQRKLLLCKVNVILINFKRDHKLEAIQLTEQLLGEVCEGPISDELGRLRQFLVQGHAYQVGFALQTEMISDYFTIQEHSSLKFKFLIPMPRPQISEIQNPQYQKLLTGFKVSDIQDKPQAPWIKRGKFGVIFTNEIQQFERLNLGTEQNQAVKSRMPSQNNSRIIQTRSRLMKELQLSKSVLQKLEKIAQRGRE